MNQKKSSRQPIKDPFIEHEGHWYILLDWYSENSGHGQTLILHPLVKEERETLLYFRESHLREAYAYVLPMVERRMLQRFENLGEEE